MTVASTLSPFDQVTAMPAASHDRDIVDAAGTQCAMGIPFTALRHIHCPVNGVSRPVESPQYTHRARTAAHGIQHRLPRSCRPCSFHTIPFHTPLPPTCSHASFLFAMHTVLPHSLTGPCPHSLPGPCPHSLTGPCPHSLACPCPQRPFTCTPGATSLRGNTVVVAHVLGLPGQRCRIPGSDSVPRSLWPSALLRGPHTQCRGSHKACDKHLRVLSLIAVAEPLVIGGSWRLNDMNRQQPREGFASTSWP